MRAAVAAAVGLGERAVTIYPMAVGGGFGRKLEVDAEVEAVANQDPLSFRISQLGQDTRLARCLQRAAAAGGWSGEPQAGQGLAVLSAFGSHIACMAELEEGGHNVAR